MKKHLRWVALASFAVGVGCGDGDPAQDAGTSLHDGSVDSREVSDARDEADASDARDADASDVLSDGAPCGPGSVLAYQQPGCGANAPSPSCRALGDPCASPVCDCNGATSLTGCGYSTVPFASWGGCKDADIPDATDAGDVVDANDVFDARDVIADDVADAHDDAHDAHDAQRDGDAMDSADAPVCGPGTVRAYNMPGCGANTPPAYCQGPTDACLGPVCDCNGVTNWSGCGYAQVPFAAWGVCPDGALPDVHAD